MIPPNRDWMISRHWDTDITRKIKQYVEKFGPIHMPVINEIEVLNRQLCFRCQTFLDVCGSWQLQTSDWKPHLLLHSFQSRMFTVAHCQQQYTFLGCLFYIISMQKPPSRLVKIPTTSVAVLLPADVHRTVFTVFTNEIMYNFQRNICKQLGIFSIQALQF